MHGLTASTVLELWEQVHHLPPVHKALALLATAYPERSPDELAALHIGHRDALLLSVREALFGTEITAISACNACGEQAELSFPVTAVRVHREASEGAGVLEAEGYTLHYRLPSSEDLTDVVRVRDVETARLLLLERCVEAATLEGESIDVQQLPVAVQRAVSEQMSEDDPQADIQLDLICPACGHHGQRFFDIVSFLWSEINVWAQQLLVEVHTLARYYGWREEDILAMSPLRRHRYLALISA